MSETLNAVYSREDAAARCGVYRLLARLWLHELDRDCLEELCASPLATSFTAAGGVLPSLHDDAVVEHLAIDYCRLFVGPVDHLPPFQSVWQTGQLQGTAVASMNSFAEIVGYDREALPAGMMLDHLGVQFDVMGQTLNQLANWRSGAEGFDQALEIERCFFHNHLTWPSELIQGARQRAETDFYRSLTVMTSDFLESENRS